MKKAQRIVGIIMIITFVWAMVYMGRGIYVLLDPRTFTSFPWTAAIGFTLIYFGPVLLLELIIYLILRWKNKKKDAEREKRL